MELNKMRNFKKIYYDLTGTPYLKVWLCGNGNVVKEKNYGMEEEIKNEFGVFEKPDIREAIRFKDKYYVYYDIYNFKQIKLKDVGEKISMEDFNKRIAGDEVFKSKIYNLLYEGAKENLKMIAVKVTPFEIQALTERSSLLAAFNPDKKNDILSQQNIIYIIIAIVVLYAVYNLLTTGKIY
jgi:hypothetical protein